MDTQVNLDDEPPFLHAVMSTAAEPRTRVYFVHVENVGKRGLPNRVQLRANAMRRAGDLPPEIDTLVRLEPCQCRWGEA